jgi:hypothetical protein
VLVASYPSPDREKMQSAEFKVQFEEKPQKNPHFTTLRGCRVLEFNALAATSMLREKAENRAE